MVCPAVNRKESGLAGVTIANVLTVPAVDSTARPLRHFFLLSPMFFTFPCSKTKQKGAVIMEKGLGTTPSKGHRKVITNATRSSKKGMTEREKNNVE